MIVLDTDVLSAIMRPEHNAPVMDWLDSQDRSQLWITAVSVYELGYGVLCLPDGQRKKNLSNRLNILRTRHFAMRLLDMNAGSADMAAIAKAASIKATGYCDEPDAMIAGIAAARGASVATRNTDHFKHFGIPLIDPWV